MHVHDKLVFEAPEAKVNWVRITSPQNMIGGVSLRTLFAGENGARCQLGTGALDQSNEINRKAKPYAGAPTKLLVAMTLSVA